MSSSDGNNVNSNKIEETKKEDYQIAICQDGKFVSTFDTANLRIRILKNTDYRPFDIDKEDITLGFSNINSTHSSLTAIEDNDNQQNSIESTEIDNKTATIAYFKINADFTINKFYDNGFEPTHDYANEEGTSEEKPLRWSLDISNIQMYKDKYFILVAVSCINVEKNDENDERDKSESYRKPLEIFKFDSSPKSPNDTIVDMPLKKGTAIYRLELEKGDNENYVLVQHTAVCHYSGSVSGICRFVEDLDKETDKYVKQKRPLKRFIILNYIGIYNFKFDSGFDSFNLNEKFDYPKSIRHELEDRETLTDRIDKLLTCIYDQYFLVEGYKNDVHVLEVYNLVEMKLETMAKRVETQDKYIRKYHKNIFSISNQQLQLCFTRGLHSVKLYLMENGLEIASKKFRDLEKIYSLEFIDSDKKLLVIGISKERQVTLIIWDIYNTVNDKQITLDNFLKLENLNTHFARTSGNILLVDDKGNVTSILRKVENKLKKIQSTKINSDLKEYLGEKRGKKLDGKPDEKHIIHFDENINPDFETIVNKKEPWIAEDYERNSYCLYQNKKEIGTETLQLIIGRSTIQIWHRIHDHDKKKNKGEPFLEYIWTNGIPVDQEGEETRLRIEEFKYELSTKLNNIDFYLKVYWEEKEITGNKKRKEKVIKWKDIIEKAEAVRHAFKALEHLNKRAKYKKIVNYTKIHRHEEIVAYISHIIWRFVRHKPDEYKLLDVRHNVMKNLILGDCDQLIKFILFGDENSNNSSELHIPRSILWNKNRAFVEEDDLKPFENKDDKSNERDRIIPKNDMELAIYHCKGRELKDTIIVAYLLEYYSEHAMKNPGWMITVSKALPLLFKYNYDNYANKLLRKECFADQDHFSAQDPDQIIPKEYLARRNHYIHFRAFKPETIKLQSDNLKWYIEILKKFELVRNKTIEFCENFDNHLGKSQLALRVVPLPGFTKGKLNYKSYDNIYLEIISKILWFIFIPRRYRCKARWYKLWSIQCNHDDENKLSPFSRMILYENNDDIYDNPAIEAVINFRWQKARNFFFFLFLRFLIFASCFIIVSWEYLIHKEISGGYRNFLVALIAIFYYLAAYLFVTEILQLFYRGPRKYFRNIFNYSDIASIVLPVITMSMMLKKFKFSNGFGSIQPRISPNVDPDDTNLMAWISFSIFITWVELISYFRLIPGIAIYIYYVVFIVQSVFPLLLFMLFVVIAFANTMFVLLRDPKYITTKDSTFTGVANNTNEAFNITLKADFNTTDWKDNPFSYFPTSIEAAYFWIFGEWTQRDHFDFWPINIFTLIASIFLVIILQNMLIALMSDVFGRAQTKSRQTLLRYQAIKIADYEALYHVSLWKPEPEPKYICYIGQSKHFEEWYNNINKDKDTIYKDFEEKSTFTKHVFKEADYDSVSIWIYDEINDINKQIQDAEKTKKDFDVHVEELSKKLNTVHEDETKRTSCLKDLLI